MEIERIVDSVDHLRAMVDPPETDVSPSTDPASVRSLSTKLKQIRDTLSGKSGVHALRIATRWTLRTDILLVAKELKRLRRGNNLPLAESDPDTFRMSLDTLNRVAEYAPTWVLIAVAFSLGLGTTVGEKIGKTHLSYAQGASAEIVAMGTIALADFGGLPVSTTHVLSSGVAGTMAANGSGLQFRTIRNIALAWVLTLPVAMTMAGGLFLLFRWIAG